MRREQWQAGLAAGAAAALTVAVMVALPGAGARAATVTGPALKLVVAQRSITVDSFRGRVFLDPGVYVAAMGSALQLDEQRASYTKPLTLTQIIHLPGGGIRTRALGASVPKSWQGLRHFLRLTMRNASGKVVTSRRITFCPNSFAPARVSPDSPMNSPYPSWCQSFDPFPRGMVWGIQKGWATDTFQMTGPLLRLKTGTYQATVTITPQYMRLFHIAPKNATAHVTVKVVTFKRPVPARTRPRSQPLTSLPRVPIISNPPKNARPDLVALPSWNIRTQHTKSGQDLLSFAATVWIGGHSLLDVEGFRANASPVMKAYQYYWRGGHLIGRTRAGTMGFDSKTGHNHWHFQQFAQYRLLNSKKKLTVRSHKQGFCIAPTDPVNLLLKRATWNPTFTGFGGQCGLPSALWVREQLPVGWGDTYFQEVAGQSFNITNVPNGTYYVEVIANPLRVLHETTTRNDASFRKVILGGTPGHRTAKVPAWHGIDPEG